jgi:hypothetical protein
MPVWRAALAAMDPALSSHTSMTSLRLFMTARYPIALGLK